MKNILPTVHLFPIVRPNIYILYWRTCIALRNARRIIHLIFHGTERH